MNFVDSQALMRSRVEHPGHLNAKVVLHIGEDQGKYVTTAIRSFSFERLTNGIGNFTMTLVDNNWAEIEEKILDAKGKGWFQYGYEKGFDNLKRKPVKIQIIGMELEPYLNYVVLNLSGLCLGTALLENSKFLSSVKETTVGKEKELTDKGVNTKHRPLHEFVRDLAYAAGYDEKHVDIDPTTIPLVKDDLFGTEDTAKIFNSKGMNVFTFLVKQVLPYAVTPDDYEKIQASKKNVFSTEPPVITPFVFFISTNENGEEVFHFHKQDKYKDRVELTRIFDLYSDPDTRVISYKPSYEHMLANITRGTSIFAWTLSPLTGTEFEERYSAKQSPSAIKPFFDYTSSSNSFSGNNFAETVKLMLYSPDPYVNMLKVARAAQLSTNAPLTAELVIVGDPDYDICNIIDINVNIPFGDKRGNPHNTSNRYMVLGITDTIDMGVFTTRLQLGTAHGSTDKGKQAAKITGEQEAKANADAQKQNLTEYNIDIKR